MKEIILTQNQVALVDNEDYEYFNQWKWHALKGAKTFYATRHPKNSDGGRIENCYIYMHREILQATKNVIVDHRDFDGLNNQRYNLRNCTPAQSVMNRRKGLNRSSIYKGVHWRKERSKWSARIGLNRKTISLGCFNSEIKAAMLYDMAAIKYFGEFAVLNFPQAEYSV